VKILQVSAGLNPIAAQSNAYLDSLPKALAARGHEVTAMHMSEIGPWKKGLHLEVREESVRTIAVRNSGVYAGLPPGAGIGTARPLREVVPSESLRQLVAGVVKEISPDVIHLQNLFGFPIGLLRDLRSTHAPVAMTEHGYFPICPTAHLFKPAGEPCTLTRDKLTCSRCCVKSQNYTMFRLVLSLNARLDSMSRSSVAWKVLVRFRNGLLRANTIARRALTSDEPYRRRFDAMRKALHQLDMVHCISQLQASRLRQAVGELPNLTVLPLVPPTITRPAPVPRQKRSGEKVRFAVLNVFAGRVDKGWNYMHGVLRRLESERADFHVDWYANGTNTACVTYHGRYAQGDLDRIAAHMDFCVMPSIWLETLGFSSLEMLARGVPLICSNRCGVAESVRHLKTGIIFDPVSEDNLYQVLSAVLLAPQESVRMRLAQAEACRRMRTFTEHVEDLSAMLENLVIKKGKKSQDVPGLQPRGLIS
jgi:glycosyltransferase involved in cell wall biosynthesis